MLALLMSNAGGAWDNSKKLCEHLGTKKTDQGEACIVGDTVGDPFKDTSGPALNILIKLMSMVSLTVAPLFNDKEDWDEWYWGLIPCVIVIGLGLILWWKEILTWKDPLAEMLAHVAKVEKAPEDKLGAQMERAEEDADDGNTSIVDI